MNRHWTKEEMTYLEEKWGKISMPGLKKKLNRSQASIMCKARKMKLGRFLWADEYLTFNLLLKELGINSYSYKQISWIKNRQFPVKFKKVNKNIWRIVYVEDFWRWAEKNRHFINWIRVKKNILGKEPEWLLEIRKNQSEERRMLRKTPWTKQEDKELKRLIEMHKYTYIELSEILQRSSGAIQRRLLDLEIKARPVKADNHIKYTSEEKENIHQSILKNRTYEQISREIGKSTKAIRGYIYRIYGSENLDKVRNNIQKEVLK